MNNTPRLKLGLKTVILFTLVISMANVSIAGTLTFSVELRERFEILDGMNKKAYGNSSIDAKGMVKGESDDKLLLQHIVAGLSYEQNENISFNFYMYDARIWGWSLEQGDFLKNAGTADEYIMDPSEEYFELYDVNIVVRNLPIIGLTATLGRQIIWYGDKRIFGPGSWGNSIGWLWDAARVSYKKKENFIDVWYGQTKTKDPESFSLTNKHEYQGVGLYSHYAIKGKGAVEPFFAWKNNLFHHTIPEENTYYYGVRFHEKDFHGINYDFTLVKEDGGIGDKSVNAYAYIAKAGYKLKHIPMNPSFIAGRLFASGDSNPDDNTTRTYVRPFGSTDGSHYGRMDIMSWSNMVDNQFNIHLDPTKKSHIKISYHNFSLDKLQDRWAYYKYKNKEGNNYTHLGDEIDLQFKFSHISNVEFQLIYSYFIAGDFIRNNVEDNDTQRLFVQCTYRFKGK